MTCDLREEPKTLGKTKTPQILLLEGIQEFPINIEREKRMVLWELTLATAYFLGLKRTYRLVLKIQRRLISPKYSKIRQFLHRYSIFIHILIFILFIFLGFPLDSNYFDWTEFLGLCYMGMPFGVFLWFADVILLLNGVSVVAIVLFKVGWRSERGSVIIDCQSNFVLLAFFLFGECSTFWAVKICYLC